MCKGAEDNNCRQTLLPACDHAASTRACAQSLLCDLEVNVLALHPASAHPVVNLLAYMTSELAVDC